MNETTLLNFRPFDLTMRLIDRIYVSEAREITHDDQSITELPQIFVVKMNDRWRVLIERDFTVDEDTAKALAERLVAQDIEDTRQAERIESAAHRVLEYRTSPGTIIGGVMQNDLDALRDALKRKETI